MGQSTEQRITLPDGRTATIRVRQSEAYTPNPHNSNRGKEGGKAAIDASLQNSGLHRGIVVAADGTVVNGNHAYESAIENGIAKAWVEIDVEGDVGVVTRRIDWKDARDPKAIAAALSDNETQRKNYDLDPVQFAADLEALIAVGEELPAAIFSQGQIEELLEQAGSALLSDEPEGKGKAPKDAICCPSCGFEFVG